MKWLWCLVVGHQRIRVSPTDVMMLPRGRLLPLDGVLSYKPDRNGRTDACARCGKVLGPHVFPN
jgi:hypothetical protein